MGCWGLRMQSTVALFRVAGSARWYSRDARADCCCISHLPLVSAGSASRASGCTWSRACEQDRKSSLSLSPAGLHNGLASSRAPSILNRHHRTISIPSPSNLQHCFQSIGSSQEMNFKLCALADAALLRHVCCICTSCLIPSVCPLWPNHWFTSQHLAMPTACPVWK